MADYIITTKKCYKCKQDKPFEEFRKCSTGKYGLMGFCKKCHSESSRQAYARNRSVRKVQIANWHRENIDRYREIKRNWAQKNRKKQKKNKQINITPNE